MKSATYASIVILIVSLIIASNFYKLKYEKAQSDLDTISAQSELLEKQIREANNEFERQRIDFKKKLEATDKQRLIDIDNVRASFIAERLRMQAESQSNRKESASLSASLKTCAGNAAEAERLLLRTLDEAELINAAYASCRSSLMTESAN